MRAKQDLRLERLLKRLARDDALITGDIAYAQHDRDETEVLFTLFAERYERGSILLTSNLSFSMWERILEESMTTAAAIDCLVHHSIILESNISSYRMEHAKTRKAKAAQAPPTSRLSSAPNDTVSTLSLVSAAPFSESRPGPAPTSTNSSSITGTPP